MHIIKCTQHQNKDTVNHLAEDLGSAILAVVGTVGDAAFLPVVSTFFVLTFLSAVDVSRFLIKSAMSSSRSGSGFRQYVNEL